MNGDAGQGAWIRAMPVIFVLIWISAVLTVWSMVYYLQKAIPEIRAHSK